MRVEDRTDTVGLFRWIITLPVSLQVSKLYTPLHVRTCNIKFIVQDASLQLDISCCLVPLFPYTASIPTPVGPSSDSTIYIQMVTILGVLWCSDDPR